MPVEAVAVRVSPNDWENSIALKLEFYGCVLDCSFTPGKENVSVPLSCHYPHLLIIIIIIIIIIIVVIITIITSIIVSNKIL